MQYIFHLGVHQTATPYVQDTLTRNLEALRAQGVFYVNAEMPKAVLRHRRVVYRLSHPEKPTPEIEALVDTNHSVADAARAAGAKKVLFSNDYGLGPAMHEALAMGLDDPAFYPRAHTCFRHIVRGFPLRKSRILVYSRNPETYLTSLYSEAIRLGLTNLDIDRFCRAVAFDSVDFDGLRERLSSLHTDLRVTIRAYERIRLGAETYMRTFLRDLGVQAHSFVFCPAPPEDTLDAAQIEALRHISMGSETKRPALVKQLREQVTSHLPNPSNRLALPDWVRERLRAREQNEIAHFVTMAANSL